ncbi:hypothetical protein C8Q74DRAFT_767798 [Fomes fomentarius]|nr:hypothetical protein C8Q74DRAFT_767798 [Fomes fomentarius]
MTRPVAYILVEESYPSLSDAILGVEEQLLANETRFAEDHAHIIDEVAPGPDPFALMSCRSFDSTATTTSSSSTIPSAPAAVVDENTSSTGDSVAISSAAVSGRATSGHPLAPLDTNLPPCSFSFSASSPSISKRSHDAFDNHSASDYADVWATRNARTQAMNIPEDASESTTRDGDEDGMESDDDDDGAVGNDEGREDDDRESTGRSDADEAEDTSGADNVVDNGDGTLTTHSIDWTTNPPRWHGRTIPLMDPKNIPNWISANFEPYSRITVCGLDGCGGRFGMGALKNHMYSMSHFNYRRKCSSCKWSTRADNFSGRHRCQ